MSTFLEVVKQAAREDQEREALEMLDRVFRQFGINGIMNGAVGFIYSDCTTDAPAPKINKHAQYHPDVKFSYYGDTSSPNDHGGIVVVANVISDVGNLIHYGVAYCSPDDFYSKEIGKNIAYNDLDQNMNTVVMGKKAHHSINGSILCDIHAQNSAPSWAKKFIAYHVMVHLESHYNF